VKFSVGFLNDLRGSDGQTDRWTDGQRLLGSKGSCAPLPEVTGAFSIVSSLILQLIEEPPHL